MSNQLLGCLNFGCVHFINAFPFSIYLQNHPQIHLTLHSPDRLLQMLLTKKINIALTSSVGALHYPLVHHPSFGIAARHRILSVNLYAQPSFLLAHHEWLFLKKALPPQHFSACCVITYGSKIPCLFPYLCIQFHVYLMNTMMLYY